MPSACLGNFRSVGTQWNVCVGGEAVVERSGAVGKLVSQAVRGPNRADAWRGDRHRLGAAGFDPNTNILLLAGCAAPGCWASRVSGELALPAISRVCGMEPSKRVDWNGGIRIRECVRYTREWSVRTPSAAFGLTWEGVQARAR